MSQSAPDISLIKNIARPATAEERHAQAKQLAAQPPIPVEIIKMDDAVIDRKGLVQCEANRVINVEKGVAPMTINRELKDEPIAIVGYGPSLHHTWPRIREFKHVWSVSKAHGFLLDRGIRPEVHVDLDPREHKTEFMTNPQPDVRYLLSTHVHPSYIDKLQAANCHVELFHVNIDKTKRLDPRYPKVKPRFDVGVEAAEIAFLNGYRDQHWFGIDYGCINGQTHAGPHWGPGAQAPQFRLTVKGEIYWTNVLFFHGLLLAEHFFCDRALVKPTLHGNGLLGQMILARGRVPRTKVLI